MLKLLEGIHPNSTTIRHTPVYGHVQVNITYNGNLNETFHLYQKYQSDISKGK